MAPMAKTPALLTIAHGTRDPRGPQEMEVLQGHLAERVEASVGNAWIEDFSEPDAVTAAKDLVAAGADRLVVVPFLVLSAGHHQYDIPADVDAIRKAMPDVEVTLADVLRLQPRLFELARTRVDAVSDASDRDGEALLITGAGSSDADANSDLAKAARQLAEITGHRWVEIAFAGVTWPTADEALRRLHRAGFDRVVRFSWSLLAGLLEKRVSAWADAVTAETGMPIADAGRFGPDPVVADAVVHRFREVQSPRR